MEKAQKHLDYINVMTYDFEGTYDNMAAHHTNLLSPENRPYIYSTDVAIRNLMKVGVDPSKIVMGVVLRKRNDCEKHG